RYLGGLDELPRLLHEARPDRILVALTARRGRLPTHLLLKARPRGVAVEDGLATYERLLGKVPIETITPSALVFSDAFRQSWVQAALGRGLSVLAALAGLVLLAPVLAAICVALVIDSKGSPFFLHERAGLRGRPFRLIKFRTMRAAAGAVSE